MLRIGVVRNVANNADVYAGARRHPRARTCRTTSRSTMRPSFSRDGTRMVFVEHPDRRAARHLRPRHGDRRRHAPDDTPEHELDPVISPDGAADRVLARRVASTTGPGSWTPTARTSSRRSARSGHRQRRAAVVVAGLDAALALQPLPHRLEHPYDLTIVDPTTRRARASTAARAHVRGPEQRRRRDRARVVARRRRGRVPPGARAAPPARSASCTSSISRRTRTASSRPGASSPTPPGRPTATTSSSRARTRPPASTRSR